MTKLLIFLALQFYGTLAVVFAVAFVERRQAARRQTIEPANEEPLNKAA